MKIYDNPNIKRLINFCISNYMNKDTYTFKDDLYQEAFLTLMKAIKKFHSNKNMKLMQK